MRIVSFLEFLWVIIGLKILCLGGGCESFDGARAGKW
jgi:hypothetical protein